jgi:hypothetical protein
MTNATYATRTTLEMVMEGDNDFGLFSGSELVALVADFSYEMAEGYTYDQADLEKMDLTIKEELLKRLGDLPMPEKEFWY